MDLCRRAARLALGRDRLQEIESLPLPQSLKNYLQYQWLTPAEPTTGTEAEHPARLSEGKQRTFATRTKALHKLDLWKGGDEEGRWTEAAQDSTSFFWIYRCFFSTPLLTWNEWLTMGSTARNQSSVSTAGLLPPGGGDNNCAQKAHKSKSLEAFLTKLATISLLLDTRECIHELNSTGWRVGCRVQMPSHVFCFFSFLLLNVWMTRGPTSAKLGCKVYAKGVNRLNYADLMAPSTFCLLELAIADVSDTHTVNLNEMRSNVCFLALWGEIQMLFIVWWAM